MTCHQTCRELLWLVRYGELDASSQPHLDHLAECSSCRDEVGFDREMVRQLRRALAERVEGMAPSPTAWEGIVRRTQAPPPSRWATMWSRSFGLVGRLRTATAMAGTGLALVLALNTQVISVAGPASPEPQSQASDAGSAEGERSRRIAANPQSAPDTTLADPQPLVVLPPPRETLAMARPAFEAAPGELGSLEITIRTSLSPPASAESPSTETILPAAPVPTEMPRPS
jgi:anti-sigma factor RsiW